MNERFLRTAAIFGDDGMERLYAARVAVFGVGGVGGHAAEALARSGIGNIDLIDSDTVALSNINRQIIAAESTLGEPKVAVMRRRILDINPDCVVVARQEFYSAECAEDFDLSAYDYIIDAIDSVSAKIELITRAKAAGTKIISSMGAGNKLDPTAFSVADIYKTSVCPLARVIRSKLRRLKIDSLKVVYSKEEPIKTSISDSERRAPASVSFVPSVAGLIIAGEVIKDIAFGKNQ